MPSAIAPMSDRTCPASASSATESNRSQPATAAASIARLMASAIAIRRVLPARVMVVSVMGVHAVSLAHCLR